MAKARTFARQFMKGHPMAGEPTYFVEKVLNALDVDWESLEYLDLLHELNPGKEDIVYDFYFGLGGTGCPLDDKKLHTIRSGHHFITGDKIRLAVWSGKPYCSPQIRICPELEVMTYDFQVKEFKNAFYTDIGTRYSIPDGFIENSMLETVAKNDGLSTKDFLSWFKYPSEFEGQVIAWVDPLY